MRRELRRVTGSEPIGPYTLLRLAQGGLDAGIPGQFFMLDPLLQRVRDLLARVRDCVDGKPGAGQGRDAGHTRRERRLPDQRAVAPRAGPLRRVDDEVAAAGPDRVDDGVALLESRHLESDRFEHGGGAGGGEQVEPELD